MQLFQKIPRNQRHNGHRRGQSARSENHGRTAGGQYFVDVYIAGLTSTYEILYRAKILDPVRTALILPEVLDESKWWQGQHQYIDPENKYIFLFVGNIASTSRITQSRWTPLSFAPTGVFSSQSGKGKSCCAIPKSPAASVLAKRFLLHAGVRDRNLFAASTAK